MRTRTYTLTASEDTLSQLWRRDKSWRSFLHQMWDILNTERRSRPELIKHNPTSSCVKRDENVGPIMLINTIIQTPVGADLSRASPIYRPSVAFHDIPLHVLNSIIGPPWHSRYTPSCVKLHYRLLTKPSWQRNHPHPHFERNNTTQRLAQAILRDTP
jgi:hypothetical protein